MDFVGWLHGREVKVAGRRTRFRDREAEAGALLRELERHGVALVYGPLGAGKSTLLRLFAEWFGGQREAAAAYVNYEDLTHGFINVKPAGLKRLRSLADGLKAAGDLLGSTAGVPAGTLANAAVAVALAARELAMDIHQRIRRAKARRVVVIHDDLDKAMGVRGLGTDAVYSLIGLYAGLFEGGVPREMPWGDKEVKAIVAVSDNSAAEVTLRYRGKGGLRAFLLWNLPRDAFLDLAGELGSPLNREALWRMLGGNVRALEALAMQHGWDLEGWIRGAVLPPVTAALGMEAGRLGPAAVLEALRGLGRPDDFVFHVRLSDEPFLRTNVLLQIDFATPLAPLPQEPWIGRRLAFQLPAYWWAIKAMAERGTVEVEARDVLKAAGLA